MIPSLHQADFLNEFRTHRYGSVVSQGFGIRCNDLDESSVVQGGYSKTAHDLYDSETESTLHKNVSNNDDITLCPSGYNRRRILTGEQAQVIFGLKPDVNSQYRKTAETLSRIYGVSAKTVRDIWLGRTWYRETYHLDKDKAPLTNRLMKKAGRPKGAKDSRPRAKKTLFSSTDAKAYIRPRNRKENMPQSYDSQALALRGESYAWEPECLGVSLGHFEDPFHNDWAFWPASPVAAEA
jgi:hypothetical protein